MPLKYRKHKKQIIRSQDTVLQFGKYKGKTVEWVLEMNPGYLLWLDDHKIVTFTQELLDLVAQSEMENYPPEEFYWHPD